MTASTLAPPLPLPIALLPPRHQDKYRHLPCVVLNRAWYVTRTPVSAVDANEFAASLCATAVVDTDVLPTCSWCLPDEEEAFRLRHMHLPVGDTANNFVVDAATEDDHWLQYSRPAAVTILKSVGRDRVRDGDRLYTVCVLAFTPLRFIE